MKVLGPTGLMWGRKSMLLFVLAVFLGLWQIAGNCRVKFCPKKRTSGGELKVNVLSSKNGEKTERNSRNFSFQFSKGTRNLAV